MKNSKNITDHIRNILEERKSLITYKELSNVIFAQTGVHLPYHSSQLWNHLGQILREDHKNGKNYMLTVLVVTDDTGRPGNKFFEIARLEFGRTGTDLEIFGTEFLKTWKALKHHQGMVV